MTTRSYILTTVLFLFGMFAYGQMPLDSINWRFEMEDSISGMTMKLVEQPEVLLKKYLWRLEVLTTQEGKNVLLGMRRKAETRPK